MRIYLQMRSCWLLLADGGLRVQPEPLPRMFMRVGQRVELTLSGALDFGVDSCGDPVVRASNPRLSNWGIQPSELATNFEPDVRRALEELGIEATVAIDGPAILAPANSVRGSSLALDGEETFSIHRGEWN
jgi:hypothetical protein